MGIWVGIAIAMFAVGTMMALKPNVVEVRLDKLRMTARKLELNPKLIACPDWIEGRHNEYGKGMIAQYALIMDDMKFAETHYQVIEAELRLRDEADNQASHASNQEGLTKTPKRVASASLDCEPLNLPPNMAPLVKGVYTKANSLVLFWHDVGYVQPTTNPNFKMDQIEPDLLVLKSTMQSWAQKLANKS